MKTVKSQISYKENASRLELFVRIIYAIPISIILWLFSFLAGLVQIILWLHILILGRRHKTLSNFIKAYITYLFRVRAYLDFVTDERPPIIPEKV